MQMDVVPYKGINDRAARRLLNGDKIVKGKIMLATGCYQGMEYSKYGDSLLETVRAFDRLGIQWQKQTINSDSYIDRMKNTLLANFLESDCDQILMVDSDMSFHPDAVLRILKHEQSIVGGFFPMKGDYGRFCGSLMPDEQGHVPDKRTAIVTEDNWCLFKAHLLPGGFLRIKRDVLERFADHYPELVYRAPCAALDKPERVYTAFFEIARVDYERHGEDAMFCKRMREMGEDLWVDPVLSFGHTGVKPYYGCYNDELLKPADELDVLRKREEAISKCLV